MNARILHALPYEPVKDRLAALGVGGGEAFWLPCAAISNGWAMRRAGGTSSRARSKARCSDPPFTARAAALLPPEPWDETSWAALTAAVKAETGRKGKELFAPVTGRVNRPWSWTGNEISATSYRPRAGRQALARRKGD